VKEECRSAPTSPPPPDPAPCARSPPATCRAPCTRARRRSSRRRAPWRLSVPSSKKPTTSPPSAERKRKSRNAERIDRETVSAEEKERRRGDLANGQDLVRGALGFSPATLLSPSSVVDKATSDRMTWHNR
jgi:hypothetical protein